MCGIAGLLTYRDDDGATARLESALGRLSHRGPDGQGLEEYSAGGGRLLLGHRRLAIIDLSDAGLQPMASPSGRYVVTFNGEIYNYVELRSELQALGRTFSTHTDTEVLLQAWEHWGADCLPRLDGMFAFVLYDRTEQTLFCIRDAFGIKPFYYHLGEGAFAWASEMPPLVELVGAKLPLNVERARSFLLWGAYDDGEDTFYGEVSQLRAGHLMRIDLTDRLRSAPTIERYWWPSIEAAPAMSFDEAAEHLRFLFLQSVRRQLRSDVPLGINLSGGIDSSAIACAVRHLEPDLPIQTFSYDASSERWSERKWAQLVIDHIGANAHWADDQSGDFAADLDDVVHAQGEPFGSTSIAAGYRVFRLARENGVTVTLDGQGADELLGGYDGYPASVLSSHIEQGRLISGLRHIARWRANPGRTWRMAAIHAGDALTPAGLRGHALRLAGYDASPEWLRVSGAASSGPLHAAPRSSEEKGRRLAARLREAVASNFLPSLLRHGDRNSMRWSIESRVPFLTTDLAEFTLGLPEHFLVSEQTQTKHIFRHAMRGIVPDAILDRKDKVGFQTPELDVLRRNRERLTGWLEIAEAIPFLDASLLKREVAASLDGATRYTSRTWRILNYCRWVEINRDRIALA